MCGVYGYLGSQNATPKVFAGLKRLDYRGYDSWGIAINHQGKIKLTKHLGPISQTRVNLPSSSSAIGHTRWATHGAVNQRNAHPHLSSDQSFALAHNGIVDNYQSLKHQLQSQGYHFHTTTDTEVIVKLIEHHLKKNKKLSTAVRLAFKQLHGRNTILLLNNQGQLIAARNGSPLVLGLNQTSQGIYLSSDTLSFASLIDQVLVLDNGQMAICQPHKILLKNIHTNRHIKPRWETNTLQTTQISKQGYRHYMLKEIQESPLVVSRVAQSDPTALHSLAKKIRQARHVYTLGSGTAGAAAAQLAFYLRHFSRLPATGLIGAEAQEYYPLFDENDLIIALSQSGETADVLEVLETAKHKGIAIASYVNMPGSAITRLSDFKFMAPAGPEICVMSTKIFVAQLAWSYLVSQTVAHRFPQAIKHLKKLSSAIDQFLASPKHLQQIQSLAKQLAKSPHIYLLAKSQNLQIIKEAMIKIIEGSYLHAHAVPAGDLKHYAITLIESGTPVIAVLSRDMVTKDVLNAVHEVKARGAHIIAIAPDHHSLFDHHLPLPHLPQTSAILNIIPLQLLAYYSALTLGNNIDKPRNIAKSVTVK